MTTKPFPPDVEEEKTAAEEAIAEIESWTRNVVTGSEVGAVRRILLYTVAAVTIAILAASDGDPLPVLLGSIGIVAILFLSVTDDLR